MSSDQNKILSGEEIRNYYQGGKNKYLLVNVVSRRSRQLINKEPCLVNREGLNTPLDMVIAEISQAKLALREEGETGLIDACRNQFPTPRVEASEGDPAEAEATEPQA